MIKFEAKVKANIKAFSLASWVDDRPDIIERLREYVRTSREDILSDLKELGAVLEVKEGHNIVVTRGRSVLAGLLAGDTTYTGEINYGALGSSTTPVANADTQLGTEVFRKLVTSQAFVDNVAYVDFYYTAAEAVGTHEEFGNFIDGTGSANSGRLFSHILTGGWVKTNTTSLFVSCQYTIN